MKVPTHPAATMLLSPLSWLYGLAIRLRNRHYDRPGKSLAARVPVLSIGNLTVGGTGKTPVVAWLAQRFIDEGLKPAIVSRGYGGRAGKGPLLVSTGEGPVRGPAECGDEPCLLASLLPGVLVVVGSDRLAGASAAADRGVDVVLLDDGFQHRRLARDLDILLIHSDRPFGNGRLLPAGPLREQLTALRRAGLIVLTRTAKEGDYRELERSIRRFNRSAPILLSRHRPAGLFDTRGAPVSYPERAVLFCGIARPELFRRDIESLGIEVVGFRDYPDHYRYTERDIDELRGLAGDGVALITTEKDLARLGTAEGLPLTVLRIEIEISGQEILLEAARAAIAPRS
jgi:tetraacyldisaccharide 4'-kinase